MKLADAPAAVRAELSRRHRFPRYGSPANGELWFGDDLREPDCPLPRCAVCGTTLDHDRICHDHCHTTGLSRGHLCVPCNFAEGRDGGPLWEFWRLHAPFLAKREIHGHPRRLTNDEVLTLPMADLFRLSRERRFNGWTRPTPPPCATCGGRGVTEPPLALCRPCGGTGLTADRVA